MFADLRRFPWVLATQKYRDAADLVQVLETTIAAAEKKAIEVAPPAVAARPDKQT
jgi:hypothetical protein